MSLDESVEYKCPECGQWTICNKWEDCEVSCEECGHHQALRCPKCEEKFDVVFVELEERPIQII